MSDLVNISSQFKGLPMGDLIGGPLTAACDSQIKLAQATASFIRSVGFLPPDPANTDPNAVGATRTALFRFKRPVDNLDPATKAAQPFAEEEVELEVPLLAIVKVPNLSIQKVDINFEMEVKSSFSTKESSDYAASMQAEMKVGWGIFSAKVNIQGSVAAHKESACLGQLGQVHRVGAGRGSRHARRPGPGDGHPADRVGTAQGGRSGSGVRPASPGMAASWPVVSR